MKRLYTTGAIAGFLLMGIGIVVDATTRTQTLPSFDTTADVGKTVTVGSSGYLAWATGAGVSGALSGTGPVTANDLVAYSGTGGKAVKDSGIPLANVVLTSRQVSAGTGLTVTPQSQLTSDITMSIATGATTSVLAVSGSTGYPGYLASSTNGQVLRRFSGGLSWGPVDLTDGTNAVTGVLAIAQGGTAASGRSNAFKSLSPQVSQGDLVVFSNTPIALSVGATGQLLRVDKSQAGFLAWSYEGAGVPSGNTAATGDKGEVMRITRVRSNATGLTSGATGATTGTNLGTTTSFTLTPGDWSCQAQCGFLAATTTTINGLYCAISATSATLPSLDTTAVPTNGEARNRFAVTNGSTMFAAADFTTDIPPYQVLVNNGSTLPLFLVGGATFGASTLTAYGSAECRRMR